MLLSIPSPSRPGDFLVEIIKKTGKSLLIGSLAGLAIALVTNFFVVDLIDRLEDQTYYMRYRWEFEDLPSAVKTKAPAQETQETDYGIHIIDIDERSLQKLGNYWNWDRSFQAELINNLSGNRLRYSIFLSRRPKPCQTF
jgi:adenylate cyclase